MASCDSEANAIHAKLLGFRTFWVRSETSELLKGEVVCPASKEAGQKVQCADCKACGGLGSKAKCNIAIIVHGTAGHKNAFEAKALT